MRRAFSRDVPRETIFRGGDSSRVHNVRGGTTGEIVPWAHTGAARRRRISRYTGRRIYPSNGVRPKILHSRLCLPPFLPPVPLYRDLTLLHRRRPYQALVFLRKRGTFASGCGTPAINLSRHAIIFVPGAGIYRCRPHRREDIPRTRVRVRVCVRTCSTARRRWNERAR